MLLFKQPDKVILTDLLGVIKFSLTQSDTFEITIDQAYIYEKTKQLIVVMNTFYQTYNLDNYKPV